MHIKTVFLAPHTSKYQPIERDIAEAKQFNLFILYLKSLNETHQWADIQFCCGILRHTRTPPDCNLPLVL